MLNKFKMLFIGCLLIGGGLSAQAVSANGGGCNTGCAHPVVSVRPVIHPPVVHHFVRPAPRPVMHHHVVIHRPVVHHPHRPVVRHLPAPRPACNRGCH